MNGKQSKFLRAIKATKKIKRAYLKLPHHKKGQIRSKFLLYAQY